MDKQKAQVVWNPSKFVVCAMSGKTSAVLGAIILPTNSGGMQFLPANDKNQHKSHKSWHGASHQPTIFLKFGFQFFQHFNRSIHSSCGRRLPASIILSKHIAAFSGCKIPCSIILSNSQSTPCTIILLRFAALRRAPSPVIKMPWHSMAAIKLLKS